MQGKQWHRKEILNYKAQCTEHMVTYSRPKCHDCHLAVEDLLPLKGSDPRNRPTILHSGAQERAYHLSMPCGEAVGSQAVDDMGEVVRSLGANSRIVVVDVFTQRLDDLKQRDLLRFNLYRLRELKLEAES